MVQLGQIRRNVGLGVSRSLTPCQFDEKGGGKKARDGSHFFQALGEKSCSHPSFIPHRGRHHHEKLSRPTSPTPHHIPVILIYMYAKRYLAFIFSLSLKCHSSSHEQIQGDTNQVACKLDHTCNKHTMYTFICEIMKCGSLLI